MRIEAERLTKRFGSRTSLREVSFDVPGGDIVGLLGPNGAGKSTTIRLLTGLIQPSEGTARLGGLDVRRDQVRIRPQLGYLPEVSPVFPDMTVESFLTFFAGIKGFAGGPARAEARRCAELVGLGASLDRLLRNLSKGTRQRAGIAQALLGRPKLVILDEPTSGLDPQQIVEVRAVIRSLREHATVLLSTHLLAEVEMTCDRVLVLARGRLVASGTLEEFRGAATGVREAVAMVAGERALIDQTAARLPASITATVGAREGQAWRLELRGPEDDPAWTAQAARAFVEARLDLLELRPRRRSLEETYLQAVQAPLADEQEPAHHATSA